MIDKSPLESRYVRNCPCCERGEEKYHSSGYDHTITIYRCNKFLTDGHRECSQQDIAICEAIINIDEIKKEIQEIKRRINDLGYSK